MSKAIVPENKHDKQLVSLGRSEARRAFKAEKAEDKADKIKSERNALRRDVEALEVEVDAGKTSHKVATAVTGSIGTAGGVALQLFVMSKVQSKVVRIGTLPTVGGLLGIGGLFVNGIFGGMMTGLGFGVATGSGTVSGVISSLTP
jgi:hypothetical protein